jgi:dimethylhistidine N-methyltransferase
MQVTELQSTLATDTVKGLTASPKQLSSRYFYDQEGSKIFQQIMHMQEYYLTDCEYEIFNKQAYSIVKEFFNHKHPIELIELGAGDGLKTKLLIKELLRQKVAFRYIPIDISEEILVGMANNIRNDFKGLEVAPKTGDYFDMMEELRLISNAPKVFLFLGSNIGNFSRQESITFLQHIRSVIRQQDKILIGFDLKKDPEIIIKAYKDPHGYTSRFNLNLLTRLNRELGANFKVEDFEHAPMYDPLNGVAKSYLVSKKDQIVHFELLNQSFSFKKWEAVFTERSQKFDEEMIHNLAQESGFEVVKQYTDERKYFNDSLLKPIK